MAVYTVVPIKACTLECVSFFYSLSEYTKKHPDYTKKHHPRSQNRIVRYLYWWGI